MNNISTLGINLAKNVFQLHGTDSKGKAVLKKRLSRSKLMGYIVKALLNNSSFVQNVNKT